MSNRSEYTTHKRQKSSASNIGYYIPQEQQQPTTSSNRSDQSHSGYAAEQYSTFKHTPTLPPVPSSSSAPPSATSHHTHLPNDDPPTSQSLHTSPLKRTASSELDPAMRVASPPSAYYYQPTSHISYNDPSTLHQQQIPQPLFSTGNMPISSTFAFNPTQPLASSSSNYASPFESNLYSNFKLPEFTSNMSTSSAPSTSSLSATGGKQSYLIPSGSASANALALKQHHHQQQQQQQQQQQHSKNNLSISSHFNLVSLHSPHPSISATIPEESLKKPIQLSTGSTPNLGKDSSTIINDLLVNLTTVDGSSINNYLLSILYKLNMPLPIDDFYNCLYNHDRLRSLLDINYQEKLDKTLVSTSNIELSINSINQILNIFKTPSILSEYFPDLDEEENKLMNINYHELLRTFLAIKILYDILIQLPLSAQEDPQNYTIPRLSIYKTYFIICQKLICNYPSNSNTLNEQQKLILGQSKLGKLIKLVYPNLLIKRLGSRGESKYNYLGVVWNENIINDNIKKLCDENELNDLNDLFSSENLRHSNISRRGSHRRTSSKHKSISDDTSLLQPTIQSMTAAARQPTHIPPSLPPPPITRFENPVIPPRLSFVTPFLKFPPVEEFTILNKENWFNQILYSTYAKYPIFNQGLIQQIFLSNENLLTNSSLLSNFFDSLIKPLLNQDIPNLDTCLYLVVILEIMPVLLLIDSDVDINLLKNLRLNLVFLINNFNSELKKLNTDKFPLSNSTIFVIMIKKVINLSDLLITFIKLLNNKKSMMAQDIENFFKPTTRAIQQQQLKHEQSAGLDSSEQEGFFNFGNFQDFSFSFRNDILSNDLVYSLIGYNYDPVTNKQLTGSIPMTYINEEINFLDEFFRVDLLTFLNSSAPQSPVESEESKEGPVLSETELSRLVQLFKLIHEKLLDSVYKTKYPIMVYNNYITYILNDILKYIFLKQQQQSQSSHMSEESNGNNNSSFGNWWVFNSFVQEYMSLLGEVVGLHDSV
ncbi:uncharacterized protein J8A68_001247 [[Candida] subhashii]|uniref:RFX-type winged-helix domain-containing protein n=1 Tax=[Candida] subhashii TaxID=561895 RepID=A0A8J5UR43_9ASCO|nr:uncharacterized protein J8A68_001247 [[Candida] subhashii]KAG7665191.1 hypothetical protein J8A68_001247 [[Candida] subhashii]